MATVRVTSFGELKPEIAKHARYLKACAEPKWFSRKNVVSKRTIKVLHRLCKIYWALRRITTTDTNTSGNHWCPSPDACAFAMYMFKEGLAETFMKMWKILNTHMRKGGKQVLAAYYELSMIICLLTDSCRELGDELVANGFVPILLASFSMNIVIRRRPHVADDNDCDDSGTNKIDDNGDNKDDDDDEDFSKNMLVLCILLYCIRMSCQNRDAYRNANAVPVIQKCLNSASTSLQCCLPLMLLAYIVTDKEREILATSERGLRLLLGILKDVAYTDGHETSCVGYTWTAIEVLDAINHLAINDTNKAEIEKYGAIPAIVHLLTDDISTDVERKVAAETLWNLSFVESIRNSSLMQDTIPTLEKLVKSSNKDFRGACASALWEIKGSTTTEPTPESTPESNSSTVDGSPPSYEEAAAEIEKEEAQHHSGRSQIMLSYQWGSQQLVQKIKDRLEKAGYGVWMDVSNIKGDILGAMASAVQESDVILMCMSERYQESRSCRSEATYAYKLNKKIIPLQLEAGYEPDGWLGLLQGMDLYYGFHSDQELDKNMHTLLKVIGENSSTEHAEDTIDGPIKAEVEPVYRETPKQAKLRAKNTDEWSKSDVQDWLRENDLEDICTNLAKVKGKLLRKLDTQRVKNEDAFKEEMKSDYKIFGQSYLVFIDALEELFPKLEKQNVKSRGNRDSCPV